MAGAPHIGRPYRSSRVAGVRRLLLRGTHYHVYDVTGEKAVIVLAVRHAPRDGAEADGIDVAGRFSQDRRTSPIDIL